MKMKKEKIQERAKELARYIKDTKARDKNFYFAKPDSANAAGYKKGIAAIIIDGILQAGMDYDTVSKEVLNFLGNYGEVDSVTDFIDIIDNDGWGNVCSWKGERKKYIKKLAIFLHGKGVNNMKDFREWAKGNENELLNAGGVGPKTRDYLQQLAGMDKVAVDAHLKDFLNDAGILPNYDEMAEIITLAGEELGEKSCVIDNAIWRYMREQKQAKKKK